VKRKVFCTKPERLEVETPEVNIWDRNFADTDYKSFENSHGVYSSEVFGIIGRHKVLKGRVLEAGCGPGSWVIAFTRLGLESHGVDFALVALRNFKAAFPHESVCNADLRALPYRNNTFDTIVSWGVVEHLPEGPTPALVEIHRCLKPNSYAAISVPMLSLNRLLNPLVYYKRLKTHPMLNPARRLVGMNEKVFLEYEFTPNHFQKLLARAGFSVIRRYPLWLEFGIRDDFGIFAPMVSKIINPGRERPFQAKMRWFGCAHMLFVCLK
jgi:SAM-dependent methyltransferase